VGTFERHTVDSTGLGLKFADIPVPNRKRRFSSRSYGWTRTAGKVRAIRSKNGDVPIIGLEEQHMPSAQARSHEAKLPALTTS